MDQLAKALQKHGIPLNIELLNSNLFGVFDIEEEVEKEEYDMTLYFDGSQCEQGGGVGIIFITPQGVPIPFSLSYLLSRQIKM